MSSDTVIRGNITSEPELKHSKKGTAWTRFSVAVTKKGKDDEKKTSFFDVKAFGEDAENFCDSFKKGDRAMVAGELVQDTYTNKEGVEVKAISVMAREISASTKYATVEISKRGKAPVKQAKSDDYDDEPF